MSVSVQPMMAAVASLLSLLLLEMVTGRKKVKDRNETHRQAASKSFPMITLSPLSAPLSAPLYYTECAALQEGFRMLF